MNTRERDFEGHDIRLCGDHRTVGAHRAWCHDCTEWCYPQTPCRGCQIPKLEAENAYLRERHAEAVAQLQPTIEVLEAFEVAFGTATSPRRLFTDWCAWRIMKMRPHLDHLKALAKEAEVG